VPTSRFTATNHWGRWVGTLSEIASLATRSHALVADRGTPTEITITVEQPGLTLRYDNPDEFTSQTTRQDLADIETISVLVAQDQAHMGDPLTVTLTFRPKSSLGEPVRLRVSGPDRTIVEGIRTQLSEHIQRGHRFPGTSGRTIGSALALTVYCVVLPTLFSGALDSAVEPALDLPVLVGTGLFIGLLSAVLILIAAPWALLFPPFEWIDTDGRTRWHRWRKRVSALILIFFTAAVGAAARLIIR
jgi:hypothetical protein